VPIDCHHQPSLTFFDVHSGELRSEIWRELADGYLQKSCLQSFESNVLLGKHDCQAHHQVLAHHLHQYSNQVLDFANRKLDYASFALTKGISFLEAVESFLEKHANESIGVHLSGGVDSSLIIGCLRELGVNPVLIGFTTKRFEFRTERHIQNILLENARGTLLDHEETLPFSSIQTVPKHQIPDVASLGHAVNGKLADTAKQFGVTLMLSGSGGDLVLGGDATDPHHLWRINMFEDPFSQDLVYRARGIDYKSFYSDPLIASSLWNLRVGKKEDSRKCWARQHFRSFLPKELVDYTFKADFWGLYMDGLREAKTELIELEETAYALTGMEFFKRNSIRPLLNEANTECEMDINKKIEARVAAASWAVALKRTIKTNTSGS